jgi:penicillin-binding protein 2
VTVLDATNGSIVAMASAPTYDPNTLQADFEQLTAKGSNFPLINRAISGLYAPGSTFKLVTAVAALQSGQLDPNAGYYDKGSVEIGGQEFSNAGGKAHGTVNLSDAITVSSDVYFYELGREMWQRYNAWDYATKHNETVNPDDLKKGYAIQDTAREFGFGNPTGIGLPGEQAGRIPDQAWKAQFNKDVTDPAERAENSLWKPGDNVNLAVGQGDLVVTPLQLASAYLAFADGGTLYTPRVAQALFEPGTGLAQPTKIFRELPTQPVKKIQLAPEVRDPIMQGFIGAVGGNGTAGGSFTDYATGSAAGKTGTAEINGKQDTSLFVGITPADAPHYVVTTVVEEAGFGSAVAAPISRRVMDALNGNLDPAPVRVAPPQANND